MPPRPKPTDFTRPFWQAVAEGRLVVPTCDECGTRFFVPEPLCPACGAGQWSWEQSSGTGAVYSRTIVHQTISPDQPVPFVLAVVDLDDGASLLTHVVEVPVDDVQIGSRVRFAPTKVDDELTLPTFTLDR